MDKMVIRQNNFFILAKKGNPLIKYIQVTEEFFPLPRQIIFGPQKVIVNFKDLWSYDPQLITWESLVKIEGFIITDTYCKILKPGNGFGEPVGYQ